MTTLALTAAILLVKLKIKESKTKLNGPPTIGWFRTLGSQ